MRARRWRDLKQKRAGSLLYPLFGFEPEGGMRGVLKNQEQDKEMRWFKPHQKPKFPKYPLYARDIRFIEKWIREHPTLVFVFTKQKNQVIFKDGHDGELITVTLAVKGWEGVYPKEAMRYLKECRAWRDKLPQLKRRRLDAGSVRQSKIEKAARSFYREYIKSPEWTERSNLCKAKADHKCESCGGDEMLVSHHYNYRHVGVEPDDDLFCLCSGCHSLYHSQIKADDLPKDSLPREERLAHITAVIGFAKRRKQRERDSADNAFGY